VFSKVEAILVLRQKWRIGVVVVCWREREKREEVFKFCLAEVNGENESLRPDVLLLK
jgi:hypothetical protein